MDGFQKNYQFKDLRKLGDRLRHQLSDIRAEVVELSTLMEIFYHVIEDTEENYRLKIIAEEGTPSEEALPQKSGETPETKETPSGALSEGARLSTADLLSICLNGRKRREENSESVDEISSSASRMASE